MSDSNWLQYAMKHYENSQLSSIEDFNEDLRRFSYINALFTRYKTKQELRLNLLLNHIVILCNVFGIEAAKELLYFKTVPEYHEALGTILLFLNVVEQIDSAVDETIQKELDQI